MPARSASTRISPARMKLSCSTYSPGVVGRLPGSPQRLDERIALVLLHGLATNRCTTPTVVRYGCSSAEQRCGRLAGPLTGLGAQLLLLAALAQTVGLGRAGWVVGAASALILDAALARALWRDPAARLGPAGWVTLTRATLAVGVAALTADSFERDVAVATLVALASVALALDFVDGRVARRTETASALGARLDGEVDAFLILALSVEVAPSAGAWVLAIGAARYAFLAAGWLFGWMRAPLPRRDWRKVVAAAQGITLTVAAAEVLPPALTRAAPRRRARPARRVVRS